MSIFGPTPLEDLDPETRVVATKAAGLRVSNANMVREIESLGGGVDVLSARVEHFLVTLANLGVITDDQLWNINLDWEQTLRPQLQDLLGQVRAAKANEQRLLESKQRFAAQPLKAAPPKLWKPPGR